MAARFCFAALSLLSLADPTAGIALRSPKPLNDKVLVTSDRLLPVNETGPAQEWATFWNRIQNEYDRTLNAVDPVVLSSEMSKIAGKVQVVLGSFSVADRFFTRETIRNTWGREPWVCQLSKGQQEGCVFYTAFVVGCLDGGCGGNDFEPDVLLLQDSKDKINQGKTQGFFKNVTREYPWATHIGKMDDDTFPFTYQLAQRIAESSDHPYSYIGEPVRRGTRNKMESAVDEINVTGSVADEISFMKGLMYLMSRRLATDLTAEGGFWDSHRHGGPEDKLAGFAIEVLENDTAARGAREAVVRVSVKGDMYHKGKRALSFEGVRIPAPPPGCPRAPTPGGILADGRPGHVYKGSWMHKVKQQSMEEANLTCGTVSYYGAMVPKMPASFVAAAASLRRATPAKLYNYNFQGKLYLRSVGRPTQKRRDWVATFAREHFANHDLFLVTDANDSYVPIGPFDLTQHAHDEPKNEAVEACQAGEECPAQFDSSYYLKMIQSNFTLCPGAVGTWSQRFYEAIMAGSIPVIGSEQDDYTGFSHWFNNIGYTYFRTDQLVAMTKSAQELEEIAEANYELFTKYQTWVHGDQVPPGYPDGSCLSVETCGKVCTECLNSV